VIGWPRLGAGRCSDRPSDHRVTENLGAPRTTFLGEHAAAGQEAGVPGNGGISRCQDAAAVVGAGEGPILMDDHRPITAEVGPAITQHAVMVADVPIGLKSRSALCGWHKTMLGRGRAVRLSGRRCNAPGLGFQRSFQPDHLRSLALSIRDLRPFLSFVTGRTLA
jgi:hypothetical protein